MTSQPTTEVYDEHHTLLQHSENRRAIGGGTDHGVHFLPAASGLCDAGGGIIMAAVWHTAAIAEYLIGDYWVYKKDYSKTESYYAARKKYIWIWAGIVILACLASGRYLSQ